MPEETRVFDVTKPKHVSPPATSKPVIVGHQPQVSDPMVKEEVGQFGTEVVSSPEPTKIQVIGATPSLEHVAAEVASSETEEKKAAPEIGLMGGGSFSSSVKPPEHDEQPAESKGSDIQPSLQVVNDEKPEEDKPAEDTTPKLDLSGAAEAFAAHKSQEHPAPAETPPESTMPSAPPATASTAMAANSDSSAADTLKDAAPAAEPAPVPAPAPHIEGLHFAQAKPKRRWPTIVFIVVALLIAVYLLIDSGVVNAGIKMPFHLFKQKSAQPAVTTSPPSSTNTPASSAPSVPAGFKTYRLATTNLTFAAPTAWGDPTSNPEPGYTQRGNNIPSDGTYAYIVDFASNKDVEVAVTSGKYLPPARAASYYDYLQWCTGTNDGKYYESILHFTTTNKVDTPSTITCDQGPVPNASKIDQDTIVEQKAPDTTGKIVGDIYTKNLKSGNLAVFRVKDASMTNGDDIKSLLKTVNPGPAASNP